MRFHQSGATLYVPDGTPGEEALRRTTHLAVGAHQDDIEIMALHGILECYGKADRWFLGITVTNGSGSPRNGLYARFTDEEMQEVRRSEQRKAACIGDYSAVAQLDFPSAVVKDPERGDVVEDIRLLIEAARPEVVYLHNLADKHDTHVAVALRTIRALRALPRGSRPRQVLGCEVWRDLDWMVDDDKVALDVSAHPGLAGALVGVFDSQISGGKRYDLATLGRRQANATYRESHSTDEATALTYAMDLTPLIRDPGQDIAAFALAQLQRFQDDVAARMLKFTPRESR